MKAEVEGVVTLMVSERDTCACCPAGHCYGRDLSVSEYDFAWAYRELPADIGDVAHDFVSELWQEHAYALEGRRVRVTFELLPSGSVSVRPPDQADADA